MKSCILTTFNFQIDQQLVDYSSKVLSKFISNTDVDYIPLRYNLPNRLISHYQSLDYGVEHLLDRYSYFLILDVDCIPLSQNSIEYIFEKIKNNILIGTAQRSMHIDNNKHIYVGSPCIGFSKELFEKIGRPSFAPTSRGDTAEELTYLCESNGIEIETFMPSSYEKDPLGGPAWELSDPSVKYGIGTTFVNEDNNEMFYHLFESRVEEHNNLFFKKCNDVLFNSSTVEMFNPFGCFFLRHKLPEDTYNILEQEVDSVKQNLNDSIFVEVTDFSPNLVGKNSYQIKMNQLVLKNSRLSDYILNISNQYLKNQNLSPTNLRLGNVWINYCYKGDYNPIHNHDSLLSGVIYIRQDEETFNDVEVNNRAGPDLPGMTHFVYSLNNSPLNKFTYFNKFEKQQVLLFPSWLNHWVNPYNGEGERITIAFNVLGDL
jgi:uncharacterized protein (TIGR02466 family)